MKRRRPRRKPRGQWPMVFIAFWLLLPDPDPQHGPAVLSWLIAVTLACIVWHRNQW